MTEWTILGRDVMRDARTARGLSYEAASRKLHISSKTYERREKAGRWPTHEIEVLAKTLGLEIEWPATRKVQLSASEEADVAKELREMRQILEEIRREVGGGDSPGENGRP